MRWVEHPKWSVATYISGPYFGRCTVDPPGDLSTTCSAPAAPMANAVAEMMATEVAHYACRKASTFATADALNASSTLPSE